MSNILIIKHGSLGDIAQISGAIQDIKINHQKDKVFLLTTSPYVKLFERCPHIDKICVDERLARWNFFYLLKLKKMISSFKFIKIYDLQNSSRTSFYKKFLFNNIEWSSTETTLPLGTTKKDYDKDAVLDRFNFQLSKSNIITKYTLRPDFSWACENVEEIKKFYNLKKYILLFPFCSINLPHKKWPHYNELILFIAEKYPEIKVVIAPSPDEIIQAKTVNAQVILKDKMALNITELAGLINGSRFVISNDTGPAHMAAHLGAKGIALFGYHTTAKKVSMETNNFKTISKDNLSDLSANEVFLNISKELSLI